MKTGAVVIGRNEGERLIRCLTAAAPLFDTMIYVDSGSTDGSVAVAERLGAKVVTLDMSRPFTAARARNAGAARLPEDTDFVQFIDGDCELTPGWPDTAAAFLAHHGDIAAVAGRLAELRPDASVYNRLCDEEWAAPAGEARACGGIALMRLSAFRAVSGFREDLAAGEEPELCLRLRWEGWRIWRHAGDMATHDADMTRFSQWWRRSRRAGRAFAQGAWLHGRGPERYYVRETLRALAWSAILPLALLGALTSPWALALLLAYPAQVARLALRRGGGRFDWVAAWLSVLGKFAEALGVLDFLCRRRAAYDKS